MRRHGALWREARRHEEATCCFPRRVSVMTSAHISSAILTPTPAKPIPAPRILVVAAMS